MAKVQSSTTPIGIGATVLTAAVSLSGATDAAIFVDADNANNLAGKVQISPDGVTWIDLLPGGRNFGTIGTPIGFPAGLVDASFVVNVGGANAIRLSLTNSGAGTNAVNAWIMPSANRK